MAEQIETNVKSLNSELTFAEIYRLLKKGAVLLTICLIIGVILTTSILLVMREFIGTISYETEITFSSASISSNEEYNPSTNVSTLIKSSTLVSKALTNLGYSEDAQKALMNSGLIENLSAYTTDSKSDNNGVTYPFVVTLSLKKMGNKTLSKAQSAALIEEITKQVILELQSQYKKEIGFDQIEALDYSKYNYLQAYDKLCDANASVEVFASSLDENVLSYSKNGVSVKSVLAKFNIISNELGVLKSRLVNNALTNETATSSELVYAINQESYYSQKATQLATRIADYATLLKDTKPDITVMTGTVTIEALKSYYELVEVYNALQDEYEVVAAKAKEWEDIKTAYSGATTPSTEVQAQFNSIVTSYNAAQTALKGIIDTYNEDNYSLSLVVENKNVVTIKDSAISPLIIVLIDVVAIAIIMIAVVIIEKKKENKQIKPTKE